MCVLVGDVYFGTSTENLFVTYHILVRDPFTLFSFGLLCFSSPQTCRAQVCCGHTVFYVIAYKQAALRRWLGEYVNTDYLGLTHHRVNEPTTSQHNPPRTPHTPSLSLSSPAHTPKRAHIVGASTWRYRGCAFGVTAGRGEEDGGICC